MANNKNQLDSRVLAVRDETKLQMEKIAKDVLNSVKRNKKQGVFKDLAESFEESPSILEKTAESLKDYANKVLEDFETELTNDPYKDKYTNKLYDLLIADINELLQHANNKYFGDSKS